ncbi:hypothetical protein M431DRAFT_543197 [Trichoderma harzianum CBS 226.95]|uniref:MADS-box domain-containing protein n=1 Tax=Trichoderma harzianum CBS 226.95 TaxID=983964 RepID=A0A2T3ZXP7_TRIHA|nr:hypothetical protein M431DRAFT_543197 [Trichoderma harzianum CBS 226.95]PTB49513.1 hypothetical protein M431DRAFT_543197 [Trichoderma harzianum CBS 226.95]
MARRRSRTNKDPTRGMRNRQRGLSRKAHFFYEEYNADVLVVIRRPDGQYTGYQSKPGLLRRFQSVPDGQLSGPSQFMQAQESDSDDTSQRYSRRSSSFVSATSSDSANTPSLSSSNSSLLSHEAPSPVDIPQPAPTPPPTEVPMSILPSIETPPVDADTFLSFLNDETSLSDNEITELLWSNIIDSTESAEFNNELPCIIQPSPVSTRQREAMLSLIKRYF